MITRYIEITMVKNSHPKQHSQMGPPDLAQLGPIWNAAWITPSSISYGPQLGQVEPQLGPTGAQLGMLLGNWGIGLPI